MQDERPASDAAGAGGGGFRADHAQSPAVAASGSEASWSPPRPPRCPVRGAQTSSPVPCALTLAQVAALPGAGSCGCRRGRSARPATGTWLGAGGDRLRGRANAVHAPPHHSPAVLPLGLESYSGSFSTCTQPETQLRQPAPSASASPAPGCLRALPRPPSGHFSLLGCESHVQGSVRSSFTSRSLASRRRTLQE